MNDRYNFWSVVGTAIFFLGASSVWGVLWAVRGGAVRLGMFGFFGAICLIYAVLAVHIHRATRYRQLGESLWVEKEGRGDE